MSAPEGNRRKENWPISQWIEEKRSAYLYRILSESERDPVLKKLFSSLADRAEAQAQIWEKRAGAGGPELTFTPELRTRLVALLARRLGARRLRPALAALKIRGLSALGTPRSGHAERHQHQAAGGNLRAAVFGINDGLVSNASLILGVAAAASLDTSLILLSGTAGLFAGALSMAAGEYVSVRSQRELLEHQLELERAELLEYPEEEALELALIYEARGLSTETARALSEAILSDPERALQTLAREELGIDPTELGSPGGAASSSFLAFSVGGLIPLLPFLLSKSPSMLGLSIGLSGGALFLTGAGVSLFSGKNPVGSGLRMLLIGGGAGTISYLIGKAVGGG